MDTIDWESQQLQVFRALKEGNVALNKLHEEMPLDKVEELMADTAESIAMEEVREAHFHQTKMCMMTGAHFSIPQAGWRL